MNPELLKIKEYYCIKLKTLENPIATHDSVEAIRAMCLSKEEEEIRLNGEFTARGGYVFKTFKNMEPWIIKPFELPDSGILLFSTDPHAATPHGNSWLWVDYQGEIEVKLKSGGMWKTPQLSHDDGIPKPNMFVCAEIFMGGTIEELSDSIKLREMELFEPYIRLCDPSAWDEDQKDTNTKTRASLFEEQGMYVIKGSKDMKGGIDKMNIEFMLREGVPRLMIFEDCRRLRFEMVNYRYPALRGILRDEKKQSDKPIDKDDHVIEATRRMVEYVVNGEVEIMDQSEMPVFTSSGSVLDINWDVDESSEVR